VRSLFVQLLVAFLAVVLLTLGAAMGATYAFAVQRANEADYVSPEALAAQVQRALSAQGPDGVSHWTVAEAHSQPEIQVYVVDRRGHELLNRRVKGQPVAASLGRAPPRVRGPDGAEYEVLVRRTRGVVFDLWNIFLKPWVFVFAALGASGLGSAWLAWRLSRPVRRLRSGVRRVAAGDLQTEFGKDLTGRRDELGALAQDINQMTRDLRGLITSKEELLRDVSHELRSPLTRLRLSADLALSGRADWRQSLKRIGHEVERVDALIGQILRFSRLGAGQPARSAPVELCALLDELVSDGRVEGDAAGVRLKASLDGQAWVAGDSDQLRSAFENVLRNALRHSPRGAETEVRLTRSVQEVRVEVSDAGPGIREGDLARVFEPFHRGEGSDGVGLGLSIARRIAELHGGRVAARNLPCGGLCVEFVLPRAPAAPQVETAALESAPAR
jgi:signal transduction histidine kinase